MDSEDMRFNQQQGDIQNEKNLWWAYQVTKNCINSVICSCAKEPPPKKNSRLRKERQGNI